MLSTSLVTLKHTQGPLSYIPGVTSDQLGSDILRTEREFQPCPGRATIHPVRKPDSQSHLSHLSHPPHQSPPSPMESTPKHPPNTAISISNAPPTHPGHQHPFTGQYHSLSNIFPLNPQLPKPLFQLHPRYLKHISMFQVPSNLQRLHFSGNKDQIPQFSPRGSIWGGPADPPVSTFLHSQPCSLALVCTMLILPQGLCTSCYLCPECSIFPLHPVNSCLPFRHPSSHHS